MSWRFACCVLLLASRLASPRGLTAHPRWPGKGPSGCGVGLNPSHCFLTVYLSCLCFCGSQGRGGGSTRSCAATPFGNLDKYPEGRKPLAKIHEGTSPFPHAFWRRRWCCHFGCGLLSLCHASLGFLFGQDGLRRHWLSGCEGFSSGWQQRAVVDVDGEDLVLLSLLLMWYTVHCNFVQSGLLVLAGFLIYYLLVTDHNTKLNISLLLLI